MQQCYFRPNSIFQNKKFKIIIIKYRLNTKVKDILAFWSIKIIR